VRYAETENPAKALIIADQIEDKPLKRSTRNSIASVLIEKNILAPAETILQKELNTPIPESEKNRFVGAPEEIEHMRKLYGKLLYKKGSYQESLKYLSPTSERKAVSEFSELYAMALIKTESGEQAVNEVEKVLFLAGEKSPEFLEAGRKLFSKKATNEKRFSKLLDSANVLDHKRLENLIAKKRVSRPSPDFKITNINGKEASLTALRGKTVVIDFWATWCIPCVGSFPAMQKAVDYYKNNKDVVFLFVHSFENSSTPIEDAKKLMAAKKYSFDVYMDLKDASKASPMATSFEVNALPTKVIIDPEGIIRYRESGCVDEGEGLREMKAMIDSSKGKNNK
jgi:thiol-disulfide isomerase/thioredoxin